MNIEYLRCFPEDRHLHRARGKLAVLPTLKEHPFGVLAISLYPFLSRQSDSQREWRDALSFLRVATPTVDHVFIYLEVDRARRIRQDACTTLSASRKNWCRGICFCPNSLTLDAQFQHGWSRSEYAGHRLQCSPKYSAVTQLLFKCLFSLNRVQSS